MGVGGCYLTHSLSHTCTHVHKQTCRDFLIMAWHVLHPPYSPDLTVTQCSFFLTHKLALRRFQDNITEEQSQDTLAKFWVKNVKKCFQQWHNHWAHCLKLQWGYSEGDSMYQHTSAVIIQIKTLFTNFLITCHIYRHSAYLQFLKSYKNNNIFKHMQWNVGGGRILLGNWTIRQQSGHAMANNVTMCWSLDKTLIP